MADNATNNDTLCDELEVLCEKEGIPFNARWARLRCMSHTTHLSASAVPTFTSSSLNLSYHLCFKLLEGIRAIKSDKSKKNRDAYQESVTATAQPRA